MSTAPEATASPAPISPANTHDCKLCGRTMAVISADGELLPQDEMDSGCDLCHDFLFYITELRGWEEKFEQVEHRREDFGVRMRRLGEVRRGKVLLGNFLLRVGRWNGEKGDFRGEIEALRRQREGEGEGEEEEELSDEEDEESDDLSDNKANDLPDKHPDGAAKKLPTHPAPSHPPPTPPTLKRSPSPSSSPGPRKLSKRPRLSDTRTRRISFDSSVVFRDVDSQSHREDAAFSRGSSEYSPGRWAAPEGSQWLDTSGFGTTIAKFTGAMKRGERWVATREGVALDEEWDGGKESDAEVEAEEAEEEKEDEEEEGDEGEGESEGESEEEDGGEQVYVLRGSKVMQLTRTARLPLRWIPHLTPVVKRQHRMLSSRLMQFGTMSSPTRRPPALSLSSADASKCVLGQLIIWYVYNAFFFIMPYLSLVLTQKDWIEFCTLYRRLIRPVRFCLLGLSPTFWRYDTPE